MKDPVLQTERLRSGAAVVLALYFVAVALISSLAGAGALSQNAFASSPMRVAAGKFWLLFGNGLVCAGPRGASFFTLVLFGTLTLAVCGPRILWTTAALGHVFSTLCVYSMIALTRFFEPSAFESVLNGRDIGVSAVCAAWLGAVAATLWRRPGWTRDHRLAIVAGVASIGTCAYFASPSLTALDTDHGFALVIGAAVALVPVRVLVKADTVYSVSAAVYLRVRTVVLAGLRATFTRPAASRRG